MSSSPNNIVNQFITKINEIGIWASYEVKVSLLKDVPSADWKIGSLHIKLLDCENISYQTLYNHKCLKLILEVRHISTLGTLLNEIAAGEPLIFDNEKASLEFIPGNFHLGFKNRQYMFTTYLIDNACFLLEKESIPIQEAKFGDIEDALRNKLSRHNQPKEGLREACKSILKVNLGGGFSPIIQVYAPVFLKLHKIYIRKGKIFVYLYCHKLIKKSEVKANLHGYDNRG
jgi:hypothetical protein